MAMNALDAGTVTACVLALVLLLLFTTYTWLKWRRRELKLMRYPQETACPTQNPSFQAETQDIDEKLAHENLQAMGHMTGSRSLLNKNAEEEFYPKHVQTTPQLSHTQIYHPKESSRSSKMDLFNSGRHFSRSGEIASKEEAYYHNKNMAGMDNDVFYSGETKPRSKSEAVYTNGTSSSRSSDKERKGSRSSSQRNPYLQEEDRRVSTYL